VHTKDRHDRTSGVRVLFFLLVCPVLGGGVTHLRPVQAEGAQVKRDTGPAKGPVASAGLKQIGRLRPRRSQEIESSRWGVSCHWIADKHELTVEQQLDQLAGLGAKWAFLVPNWDLIETEKGKYDWNSPAHRLDDVVNGLVKRKISPIIQVYGGNHLYTPLSPVHVPPGVEIPKLMTDPEAKRAWHAWLRAMAQRYNKHVKLWEIWNEPNSEWFWKPKPDARLYGRMVKEVTEVIRGVDPSAMILAGSTAAVPLDFLHDFLKSEGADSFDFWSVHPYGGVPEEMDADMRRAQQLLAASDKCDVLWQTECGFPSHADTGGWGYGGPWDEVKHAKWVLRRLLADMAVGTKISIYFVLNDYPAILEGGPDKGKMGINRKGLFHGGSWERKPAAYAFSNLAGLLDDRFQPKPLRAELSIAEPGSFGEIRPEALRTLTLTDRYTHAPAVVYWLGVPMQTDAKAGKAKLGVAAGAIRQPVLVDLLDGRVYELPPFEKTGDTIAFVGLPVSDSPIVLCGRTGISIEPG